MGYVGKQLMYCHHQFLSRKCLGYNRNVSDVRVKIYIYIVSLWLVEVLQEFVAMHEEAKMVCSRLVHVCD